MNGARKAERILTAIPGMSGARVETMLSDGPTNVSYKVRHCGESFVLRLDKTEARALGLDRRNEKIVYGHAAAAGLTPGPTYFDPGGGVFLRRFMPGRSWLPSDLAQADNLVRLATVLQKLHSLPLVGVEFDPLGAVRRYTSQLNTEKARSIGARAEGLLAKIESFPAEHSLCHNDLVCHNVLVTGAQGDGALLLIDWEYAAVGDPWFDLAVVMEHHGLDDSLVAAFIGGYLGRPPGVYELERLQLQREFYAGLLSLWQMRT